MSYNWQSKNSNHNLLEIPLTDAPDFSQTDLDAMQFIWGKENSSTFEYSLLADISDDGMINESIGHGGINYDKVYDKLTGLAISNHLDHSHSIHKLSAPSAMLALNEQELSIESLNNVNPFEDNDNFEDLSEENANLGYLIKQNSQIPLHSNNLLEFEDLKLFNELNDIEKPFDLI